MLLKNKAFFESSYYHGHAYGIQKKDVHKNGIVIVEPNGANTLIKALDKEVYVVFVESSEALRKKRMELRCDDPDIIVERIKQDRLIFNVDNLDRVDLNILNESKTLEELARFVNQSYQQYIHKKQ